MVRDQMQLIQEVQTAEWWQDVTVPMLERVRRRLRDLIKFIEKKKRKPVYTDFEDEMGGEINVELPGIGSGTEFEKFRTKARMFLLAYQDHLAIHKLRMNRPLTTADLNELERMLVESRVGTVEDIEHAKQETEGFGLFLRALVGLDREAAKLALAGFLQGKTFAANQIEFVNLVIDHLTEHGAMNAARLYESPFTDLAPLGPDSLFDSQEVDALVTILHEVRASAVAL